MTSNVVVPHFGCDNNLRASPESSLVSTEDPKAGIGRIARQAQAWWPVLKRLGLSFDDVSRIAARAVRNGTGFQAELRVGEQISENDLYRAMAAQVGLRFMEKIDPDRLSVSDEHLLPLLGGTHQRASTSPVFYKVNDGTHLEVIGAEELDLAHLLERVGSEVGIFQRMIVVSPVLLRRALQQKAQHLLGVRACETLAREVPDCSARQVMTAAQKCAILVAALLVPVGFALWPASSLLALHLFCSLFFLACVWLRIAASARAQPPRLPQLEPVPAAELPTYSVLVALYHEAEIVPELIAALGKMVWPRAKLEIKLVCEADDAATLSALRAQPLKPWFEIIEVTAIGPRTKPKALTYALPLTRGAFVVIYDAEDKPHPLQLLDAWQNFRHAPPELACLQAPLVITNTRQGMIQRMFGFEYAGLFRGLLPWLSRRDLLLPLGGTSNHFRRPALEAAGSWDPFNVTEDADLGLRLMRFGYHCGTISYPTFEDAPDTIRDWIPQRTRWFKGWLQTWFVHMRDPARLKREIGWGSFLLVQILFAGLVVSALVHPLMLVTLVVLSAKLMATNLQTGNSLLLVIDTINIACGYAGFLVLGAATLVQRERHAFWRTVVATPVYWLMLSWAAWRAVWQLYARPFHWEKTPHKSSRIEWQSQARQIDEPRSASVMPESGLAG